jgi:hypothetical protein
MSQNSSILRTAEKNRRHAERSLAELAADLQENTAAERRLLSTLAQIESILQQVSARVALEGLGHELLLIRNHAFDQLANCHDMLRQNRDRTARLLSFRASFERVAAEAAAIATEAAQDPAGDSTPPTG